MRVLRRRWAGAAQYSRAQVHQGYRRPAIVEDSNEPAVGMRCRLHFNKREHLSDVRDIERVSIPTELKQEEQHVSAGAMQSA